jgi:hypothetical protein
VYAQIVTPLHEDGDEGHDELPVEESLAFIRSKVGADFRIDQDKAVDAIERGDGIPVAIGRRALPGFEQENVSRPLPVRDSRSLESSDRESSLDGGQMRRRYSEERQPRSRDYQYDYDESGRRPQEQSRSSGYGYDEPPLSTQSRRSRESMPPRSGSSYRDEMAQDRDFSYYQDRGPQDHGPVRSPRSRDSYAQRSSRSGPTYQTPENDGAYYEDERDPYRAQQRDRNYRPESFSQRDTPPRSRDQRNRMRDYDSYADERYDDQEEGPLPWDPLHDGWNWVSSLFQ